MGLFNWKKSGEQFKKDMMKMPTLYHTVYKKFRANYSSIPETLKEIRDLGYEVTSEEFMDSFVKAGVKWHDDSIDNDFHYK
jgi:hypothetical protein